MPLTRGIVGAEATFDASGPNLADVIGAFTEAEGVPRQPFDLEGLLQVRDDGYRFRKVEGNIGSSTVAADGLLTTEPGLAGTRFSFAVEGPELDELTEEAGYDAREGPFELSGKIALQSDRIAFDDIELVRENGKLSLDVDLGLPVSNLNVRYNARARGPDVRDLSASLGPFQLKEGLPFSINARGEVGDAYVRFDTFDVQIGDAMTHSEGEVRFDGQDSASELYWTGNLPSLAKLFTVDGKELNDQGISWSANLVGEGNTLKIEELQANVGASDLRGNIYFTAGDVPELNVDVYSTR